MKNLKKKKWVLILVASVLIVLLALGLLFSYFYYHERNIIANSVLMTENMNEQQAEAMTFYECEHFGIVDEETPNPDENDTPIKLTDEQRDAIRLLIDGKEWKPYPRLWYRFDAIIMCDNERKYMLDLENGIIFIDPLDGQGNALYGIAGDEIDPGWRIRSCILLSENELNALKETLKGTGIKHTD